MKNKNWVVLTRCRQANVLDFPFDFIYNIQLMTLYPSFNDAKLSFHIVDSSQLKRRSLVHDFWKAAANLITLARVNAITPQLDIEPSQSDPIFLIASLEHERIEGHLEFGGHSHECARERLTLSSPIKLHSQDVLVPIRILRSPSSPLGQNVSLIVQLAFPLLKEELNPVVEASYLPILLFSDKDVFEAATVIVGFSSIECKPHLIELLLEVLFVRIRKILRNKILKKGREEE